MQEQRVPAGGGGVGGHGEGGHVGQLLRGVGARGRLVQHRRVLVVLRQPLQHGQRLAEVHRDRDLGQLLAWNVYSANINKLHIII